jgi:uncharacterized protein YbdZ (MbtH family)
MARDEDEDKTIYKVVLNHEEQYSIWPVDRENPLGWRDDGKTGAKADCLAHIKEVWTDMRPLSLRKKMAELAAYPPEELPPPAEPRPPNAINELVQRLTKPQTIKYSGSDVPGALKEAIERGYVQIMFVESRGGTELGVLLERDRCDFKAADFQARQGVARVVGTLTLNYERVRCHAEIDLATGEGRGHLEHLGKAEPFRRAN